MSRNSDAIKNDIEIGEFVRLYELSETYPHTTKDLFTSIMNNLTNQQQLTLVKKFEFQGAGIPLVNLLKVTFQQKNIWKNVLNQIRYTMPQSDDRPVCYPTFPFLLLGHQEHGSIVKGFSFENQVRNAMKKFTIPNGLINKLPSFLANVELSQEETAFITHPKTAKPFEMDVLYLNSSLEKLGLMEIKSCYSICNENAENTHNIFTAVDKALSQLKNDLFVLRSVFPEPPEILDITLDNCLVVLPDKTVDGVKLSDKIMITSLNGVEFRGRNYRWNRSAEAVKQFYQVDDNRLKKSKTLGKRSVEIFLPRSFVFENERNQVTYSQISKYIQGFEFINPSECVAVMNAEMASKIIYFTADLEEFQKTVDNKLPFCFQREHYEYVFSKLVTLTKAKPVTELTAQLDRMILHGEVNNRLDNLKLEESELGPKIFFTETQQKFQDELIDHGKNKYTVILGGYGSGKTVGLKMKIYYLLQLKKPIVFGIFSSSADKDSDSYMLLSSLRDHFKAELKPIEYELLKFKVFRTLNDFRHDEKYHLVLDEVFTHDTKIEYANRESRTKKFLEFLDFLKKQKKFLSVTCAISEASRSVNLDRFHSHCCRTNWNIYDFGSTNYRCSKSIVDFISDIETATGTKSGCHTTHSLWDDCDVEFIGFSKVISFAKNGVRDPARRHLSLTQYTKIF